jgi:acetyltransferase-like isoleucine patch superfamily enzyme
LRKDHRPYFIKKLYQRIQNLYAKHYVLPHLDFIGPNYTFMKPWHVKIFGPRIRIGECATIIAESDKKINIAVWSDPEPKGSISIGDYTMICPGARIGSADKINIGNNCMLASYSYITDADWHGIYNRITIGNTASVSLADNVWIGDSSIVCKGVAIGENSIIGAGSVVTGDIPPNCIAAGNPAKIMKQLDPEEKIIKRDCLFSDSEKLFREFDIFDKQRLKKNSVLHWIRYLLYPAKND